MKVSAKFSGWDEWDIPEEYAEEFKSALAAGKFPNGSDVREWLVERDLDPAEDDEGAYEYLNVEDNGGVWTVEAEDGELTNDHKP